MIEVGKKLKKEREAQNLTIKDVSAKTKIRHHILTAIENGQADDMQPIYLQSFIKTYASFLKLPLAEFEEIIPKQVKPIKKESIPTFDDEKIESKPVKKEVIKQEYTKPTYTKPVKDSFRYNYSELAKKAHFKKTGILTTILYIAVFIIVTGLAYLIFVPRPAQNTLQLPNDTTDNTTVIGTEQKNKLLSYFDKQDSLVLVATAVDTAWVRIEIDGNMIDELLMTPTMRQRWTANEYFLVTQGNIGAIRFERNGELLEPFGRKGTLARNVKITKDTILNVNPLSINGSGTPTPMRRKKEVEPEKPRRIEPLNIQRTPNIRQSTQPVQENEETQAPPEGENL